MSAAAFVQTLEVQGSIAAVVCHEAEAVGIEAGSREDHLRRSASEEPVGRRGDVEVQFQIIGAAAVVLRILTVGEALQEAVAGFKSESCNRAVHIQKEAAEELVGISSSAGSEGHLDLIGSDVLNQERGEGWGPSRRVARKNGVVVEDGLGVGSADHGNKSASEGEPSEVGTKHSQV